MAANQRYKKIIFILILILSSVIFFYFYYKPSSTTLPTYFNYSSDDMAQLAALDSSDEITKISLKKWDVIMFKLIKNNKVGDIYASRIYAYVYIAQRDAAFISKNVKKEFMGSIGPLSAEVLCLFFTDSCATIKAKIADTNDSYSNLLAKIVLKHVVARINEDKKQYFLYPEKTPKEDYWVGVKPYYGQGTGSWKTWLIESSHEFIAPAPPVNDSPQWETELSLVKTALKNITPEQTTSVVFWAGNPSTITPPGIWLRSANDYMEFHHLTLSQTLYIRSILAMGIADAIISVFNSKYTYWVKRPFMRDPTIHTVMPTPNHPSYPAGHSTLSSTAATILNFYLPENQSEWNSLAITASEGRVWGGIHFVIDAREGFILGAKIGDAILAKNPPLAADE